MPSTAVLTEVRKRLAACEHERNTQFQAEIRQLEETAQDHTGPSRLVIQQLQDRGLAELRERANLFGQEIDTILNGTRSEISADLAPLLKQEATTQLRATVSWLTKTIQQSVTRLKLVSHHVLVLPPTRQEELTTACEDAVKQLAISIDAQVTSRLPRPHTQGRVSRWTEATSWVIGILAGLFAIVAALWYGFPSLVPYLPESVQPTLPRRQSASRFTIAVVRLANDPNQEHEQLIIEELKRLNIEILPLERTITLGRGSQSEQDRERTAHDQARTYVATTEADALIWGYVHTIDGKSASRLYWTTARDTQRSQTAHAPKDFRLPDLFWQDLTKVLQLLIAHESAKFTAQKGHFVSDQLAPFVEKVRQLLADTKTRDQSWNADTLATVRLLLANALSTVGEQTGTPEPLVEATSLYKTVLAHNTRERVPLDWAETQNNLGTALSSLGERESSPERLQAAVTAYQEALKEYTRERVPLDWAITQNNLGVALWTLGEREKSPERLQAAVTAYQEALKEGTRERVPLDWAITQNNLGTALWTLGEREKSPERLQAAVTAYQEALKEYTRERVPLDWAMTQNNLGNALQTLGKRENSSERLQAAVTAYQEALKEGTRERVPLDWATTQNNLGTALWTLGEREKSPERLQAAVTAYQEALKERTRERVPLDWAMTQNNLGTALQTLGERENSLERLQAAVTAYQEALKERTRERVPLDWAETQNNLGTALRTLGEREKKAAFVCQALDRHIAAWEVFVTSAPYYAKIAREGTQRDSELLREQVDAPEAQACLNQSAALRKRMDESSIPD